MNIIEITVLLAAFILLICRKGKLTLRYLFIWAALLFFSTAMLSECMTVDEYGYMKAFIDIRNIADYINPMKAIYEYRTSQMVFGTFFQIIPQNLKSMMQEDWLLRSYKIVHYFFFFGMALLISWIWSHKILEHTPESKRFRFVNDIILYCLLALPVSCLLLKVCNYDASSVYFAVLAFSLMIAGEKRDDLKYAFAGTVAAMFGCMDKWTGFMYWYCCAVFFIYIGIRGFKKWNQRLCYAVKYCLEVTAAAVGISWLNLQYLNLLEHGLNAGINIGNVLFPLTQTLRALLFKNMSIDYGNEMAYCDGAVGKLLLVMLMVLVCALFICLYDDLNIWLEGKLFRMLGYANAFLLCLSIVGGIIAVYFIPQYIAPYKEIVDGCYISKDTFDGWIYHYGAGNAAQHFVYKLFYAYAVILCSYPSVMLVLLLCSVYILARKNRLFAEDSFMQIMLFISLIQPVLFSIAGLPAGARYYAVTIILQAIICSYYFYIGTKEAKVRKYENAAVYTAVFLCIAEMLQFVPNIAIFSPVWAVHPESYKTSVRKGVWYAGEAMTWGEDMAIAGKIIKRLADEAGIRDYSKLSIYGNYGTVWLNNPGFCIGGINKGAGSVNYKWDDTEYMVLSKFMISRILFMRWSRWQ